MGYGGRGWVFWNHEILDWAAQQPRSRALVRRIQGWLNWHCRAGATPQQCAEARRAIRAAGKRVGAYRHHSDGRVV